MLPQVDPTSVFVVIPAFNEEPVIRTVLLELVPLHYSLVIVDDGSDTELKKHLQEYPVSVLRHSVNLGQGAALQTGIEYALSRQAKFIVTYDADGQHLASDIERMLEPLLLGETDITLGSRFMSETNRVPAGRKWLLHAGRYFNYFFTGLMLTDAHNGLRAMTAGAASKIRLRQSGMAHATEILSEIKKHKLRYREIPVTIRYTDYSKQKGQKVWSSFRIFFDILLNKIFR
ncbi:MAG: glycosyltransferase family 2 protein [Chitinophagaceae bacterium]